MQIFKLILKIFLTILVWFGIACLSFGIFLYCYDIIDSIRLPIAEYANQAIHRISFGRFLNVGVILVLFCGLIARPRYLWPVLLGIGVIFSIVETVAVAYSPIISTANFQWLGQYLIGIVCIIEGLVIRWFKRRQTNEGF